MKPDRWPPWAMGALAFSMLVLIVVVTLVLVALLVVHVQDFRSWG